MNQHTSFAMDGIAPVGHGVRSVSKHKQRVLLAVTLLLTDLTAVFFGLAIASVIRFGHVWTGINSRNVFAIVPFYVISAVGVRALNGEALIRLAETLKRGMLALTASASLLLYLLFATQDGDQVSRAFLTLSFACAALMLAVLRPAHVYVSKRVLGGSLYSVLVLNDGAFPTALTGHIPVNMNGRFDPANPSAEDYHRLAGLLSSCDRVVVRCAPERRDLWAHVLQGMNVYAEIVAPEITQTRATAIGMFAGRPTFVVAQGPLNLRDRTLKRIFDLVLASTALLFLAPIMLLVAVVIKLESPGPALFRQKRIGRQNRLFDIYKFRSMRVESCDLGGTRSATRDDDRITRIGRLIRRSSIDELPQLLNVLKGDMSIVGPRPHAVHSTAKSKLFWEVDARYWYRHACKPGITGLAQIRGHRGATHEESDLTDRLEADLEYLGKWSFWNDVAIIVKTVMVIVHPNAY